MALRRPERLRWQRFGRVVACGVVAAGVAVLGATVAISEQGCAKDAPQPSSPSPIVVGVSLGLTNDLGSFTAPLRDAVRVAEGEINAGGGLLGRPIQFDVVDDRSDEGDGVKRVIQDFANRNVVAVIGPVSSGQVKATQDILSSKQIIQITPAATSVELTDVQPQSNRFLFRTTPADDFQGAAVILFATKTPRGLGDAGVSATDAGGPVDLQPVGHRLPRQLVWAVDDQGHRRQLPEAWRGPRDREPEQDPARSRRQLSG